MFIGIKKHIFMLYSAWPYSRSLKGVVDCFFLGFIVFMVCSLTCVNASLLKNTLFFHQAQYQAQYSSIKHNQTSTNDSECSGTIGLQ